jgi:hypothetical protein
MGGRASTPKVRIMRDQEILSVYGICCVGAWLLGAAPAFAGTVIMVGLMGIVGHPFNPDSETDVFVAFGVGGTLIGGLLTMLVFLSTHREPPDLPQSRHAPVVGEWRAEQMRSASQR